ncbi:response regulator [Paramagnetospirillum magnetotacticum]|uniref:response regulator n=1 Tax=Paramagnetospirillum magnetotacticum TaxID=188 RepID=UPI0009E2AC16|nr:response regulator [Paramagnetospirillum magnetotacticum]
MEKFELSGVRALVIDDDLTSRTLLVRLLTVRGASQVQEASEGGEGVRLAFSDPKPHFVICDVNMMPVDGLAVLGAIRGSQNKDVMAIPVIIFTASNDEKTMRHAMSLGATGALQKPFNPNELSEFICHIVRTHVKLPKSGRMP